MTTEIIAKILKSQKEAFQKVNAINERQWIDEISTNFKNHFITKEQYARELQSFIDARIQFTHILTLK